VGVHIPFAGRRFKRERPAADERGVDLRSERVVLETARHRITGVVTLARDGYRSRVSDVLNASERDFLALTEATVTPVDGVSPASVYEFLAVHRDHIVFLAPARPGATLSPAAVDPAA
jgi:hypothetical protein